MLFAPFQIEVAGHAQPVLIQFIRAKYNNKDQPRWTRVLCQSRLPIWITPIKL